MQLQTSTHRKRIILSRGARLAARCLAPAAFMALAGPASADVTIANWDDAWHYDYHVNYMPDLDQRRVGLDNSGNMHCVPTATMNMLAYAAQWGFDSMDPGPGLWQGYDGYYPMTAHIEDLGDLMGTTGDGGTGGTGWRNGLEAWIDGQPLVADHVWKSGNNCPTLSDIVQALEGGRIGCLAYGRYDWEPGFQGALRLTGRTGGHAVTVMHASSDGFFDETLWTRDPADDNPVDVFSQSPFAYRIYSDVLTTQDLQHDPDEDGAFSYFEGTMLEFNPDSDKIRLIDSYMVLRPINGYSYNHVQIAFEGLAGGGWIQSPSNPNWTFNGIDIIGLAPLVGFNDFIAAATLGPDTSQLIPLNRFRNQTDDAVVLPYQAVDVYVDPDGFAYVAGPWQVEKRDNVEIHELLATYTTSDGVSAMAGDDARRALWLYSDAQRTLTMLKQSSLSPAATLEIPAWFPTTPIKDLTVCPESGALWCVFEEDDRLFKLVVDEAGGVFGTTASHPDLVRPVSVTCDDRGRVIASDGEKLHAFKPVLGGAYAKYDDPWYADETVVGAFRVDRSRTNYNPAEHDAPGWNVNVHPDELEPGVSVPDCVGDLDGDGQVGAGDLSVLLAAWGSDNLAADIAPLGGDGVVDQADLATLLAAWGGCP